MHKQKLSENVHELSANYCVMQGIGFLSPNYINQIKRIMKDYLYCIVCLIWDAIYGVVLRIDSDAVFDKHPVWRIRPNRIIRHIVKKYGCINNALNHYRIIHF